MSMDQQYEMMNLFLERLKDFDEKLSDSYNDMTKFHDEVSPLWEDSVRQLYDKTWEPFKNNMEHYINIQSKGFEGFLENKLNVLRRYLFDG